MNSESEALHKRVAELQEQLDDALALLGPDRTDFTARREPIQNAEYVLDSIRQGRGQFIARFREP